MENLEKIFNDSMSFDKGLSYLLYDEWKGKLLKAIEYCVTTHDINSLREILAVLNSKQFPIT